MIFAQSLFDYSNSRNMHPYQFRRKSIKHAPNIEDQSTSGLLKSQTKTFEFINFYLYSQNYNEFTIKYYYFFISSSYRI